MASLFKPLRLKALLCAAGGLSALAMPALAYDYPTADRVTYVEECMRQHPGSSYEMLNKCSCVIDRLARDISHDDFVTMSTASNANTIGGERGNTIRDTQAMQDQIKRFRALQSTAKKGCFINSEPK
jgi:hypothetical protein